MKTWNQSVMLCPFKLNFICLDEYVIHGCVTCCLAMAPVEPWWRISHVEFGIMRGVMA